MPISPLVPPGHDGRLSGVRMTANAIDKTLEWPEWIRRKSINDRLNYIVRMQSEVCANNWYLWIEAAVEAAPKLVYSLQAVSKVDVLKEVLEQDYKCGIREMMRNGKRAGASNGERAKVFFWKIAGLTTRLFWYWLIIEEVTAFIVDWQSIVIAEQKCDHPPHAGPCILSPPGSTLGSIVGSTTLFYTGREYDPSAWSGTGGNPTVIGPNAAGNYNVGCDVTCVWASSNNITWHLDILNGIGQVVATSASVTSEADVPSTATCFAVASCPTSAMASFTSRVVVTTSPGATFGHCTQGTFSVGIAQ